MEFGSFERMSRLRGPLFVEPPIFHPPAVVLAVDHQGHALQLRLPTGRCAQVIWSAFQLQLVARSGTIDASLFWGAF
jgi:hypothetical protein